MFNSNNLHTLVAAHLGGLSVFLYTQDNSRDDPEAADYWLNASDFGAKVGDFVIIKPSQGEAAAIHRFDAVTVNGTSSFVQAIKIDMIHAVAPALAVLAAASAGGVAWDDVTGKPDFGDLAILDQVGSAQIADFSITNSKINGTAAIALSKLATGALPTAITVASANLVNGAVADAKVSASANIALSKLANVAAGTDGLAAGTIQATFQALATRIQALETP